MQKIKIDSTLENKKKQKKSIFNSSSAVFLVLNNPLQGIATEVSLLNHFLIKRGILDVKAEIILRSLDGTEVDKYYLPLYHLKTSK